MASSSRQMAASLLIREGASVKAVQRSLGHKSAMMTLDRSAARRWSICAKEQVSDLLLLVEVGRLELPRVGSRFASLTSGGRRIRRVEQRKSYSPPPSATFR
jgi:hypothetical protein